MKKIVLSLMATGALVATTYFGAACTDDHTHSDADGGAHTSAFPDCQAIIDVCHEVDVGEGAIHDCHELAHDSTSNESCTAKKAECFATCSAGEDGGAEAGEHQHDMDASMDAMDASDQ